MAVAALMQLRSTSGFKAYMPKPITQFHLCAINKLVLRSLFYANLGQRCLLPQCVLLSPARQRSSSWKIVAFLRIPWFTCAAEIQ